MLLQGSEDETTEAGPSSVPPRLRIKLKLPAQGSAASSRNATGTSTPEGPSRRRYARRGMWLPLNYISLIFS